MASDSHLELTDRLNSYDLLNFNMENALWPDQLHRPDPARIETLLAEFWRSLQSLPDLLNRAEHLLAEQVTAQARAIVLEMMLALNGIAQPTGTHHLNSYLGASQRQAIEKTLVLPYVGVESWVGRAVALVVIYRWYAPQLVEKYQLTYPAEVETAAWTHLQQELPDWPATVTTG